MTTTKLNGSRIRESGAVQSHYRETLDGQRDPYRGAGERSWKYADPDAGLVGKSFEAPSWFEALLSTQRPSEQIRLPYRESAWVHAALKMKSSSASTVPLAVFRGDPDDGGQPVPDSHPVARLLAEPSPDYSTCELFQAGMLHRALCGEDFWVLRDRDRGLVRPGADGRIPVPAEVEPVAGWRVDAVLDESGRIARWKFMASVGQEAPSGVTVLPEQAVQFRDFDPYNPLRGLGDVEVLMRHLQQEFSAEHYIEGILRNGGDPGGWVKVKYELSPETRREMQKDVDDKSRPSQRGRWHVLDGEEIEITPNNARPKDMEFPLLFNRVRDLTSSVLGVPLPVMGVLERATFSNYDQAAFQFWVGGNGIIAYLLTVEDRLNRWFRRLAIPDSMELHARFDLTDVDALNIDAIDKRDSAIALMKVPGMTWNRASAIVGLDIEPTPEGDVSLVASGLVPFEQAAAGTTTEDPGSETADDDEREDEEEPRSLRNSEPERAAYWRSVDVRLLRPGELRLRRAASRFLRRYLEAQVERLRVFAEEGPEAVRARSYQVRRARRRVSGDGLTEADLRIINLNREEWERIMADAVSDPLARIAESAGMSIAQQLGTTFVGVTDPEVVRFLVAQQIKVVEGVNSTLAAKVRQAVLRHFADVGSIGSLQELIAQELPALTGTLRTAFKDNPARALTIARTETAHATNGARNIQMRRDGVRRHVWITSRDAAVRDSHKGLDGEERRIGEPFLPGLSYPTDPSAPAGEVINCRCVTAPITEDTDA